MGSQGGDYDLYDDVDDGQRSLYGVLNVAKDASADEIKRSYRNAAQAFHPDKHTDPGLRERAKESFSKLQEAYEILSDAKKREVYDVYGKEGLIAGLAVGDHYEGHAKLKREWEDFQRRRAALKQEQLANHKGTYVCRIDGTEVWRLAHAKKWGTGPPLFKSISVQNSIEAPIGENDVVTVQGMAVLRNQIGTGNLIFGYRRTPHPDDSLEGSVVLGAQTMLSASTTRRLSPLAQATLTSTWSFQDGLGLQVSTTRNLFPDVVGSLTWVVGPPAASGMSLSVMRRGHKHTVTGKLDVGAVTAVTVRGSYAVTDSINMRAIVRAGAFGFDLEVGTSKRWSPSSAGYMGCVVGVAGIVIKTRYVRGGQTFEVPILVSHEPRDWRVLLASYTLPPLLYWSALRYVVRPVARWQRQRKEREGRAECAEQVMAALKAAVSEQELLMPVARRRARGEAERGRDGLVVLEAVYGALASYLASLPGSALQPEQAALSASMSPPSTSTADGPQPSGADSASGPSSAAPTPSSSASAGTAAVPATATSSSTAATANGSGPPQQGEGAGTSGSSGGGGGDGGGVAPTSAGGQAKGQAGDVASPTSWLFVTAALQYMVADGRLMLHENGSKAYLMGFADMAPGQEKQLYIAYQHGGAVYEVVLSDTAAATLPTSASATLVTDDGKRRALLARGSKYFGLSS